MVEADASGFGSQPMLCKYWQCLFPFYNKKWEKSHESLDFLEYENIRETFKRNVIHPHMVELVTHF